MPGKEAYSQLKEELAPSIFEELFPKPRPADC